MTSYIDGVQHIHHLIKTYKYLQRPKPTKTYKYPYGKYNLNTVSRSLRNARQSNLVIRNFIQYPNCDAMTTVCVMSEFTYDRLFLLYMDLTNTWNGCIGLPKWEITVGQPMGLYRICRVAENLFIRIASSVALLHNHYSIRQSASISHPINLHIFY